MGAVLPASGKSPDETPDSDHCAHPALANPVQGKVLRLMPRVERVKLYETNAGESVENRVVTSYTMDLTPERAGLAFALTVGMCAAAGLLAMRRLTRADPAELFR